MCRTHSHIAKKTFYKSINRELTSEFGRDGQNRRIFESNSSIKIAIAINNEKHLKWYFLQQIVLSSNSEEIKKKASIVKKDRETKI